jgi:hypothetical protein
MVLPDPLLNVLCNNRCILGPKLPNRWAGKPLASSKAIKEQQNILSEVI